MDPLGKEPDQLGRKLVFLISQPRSGSTLLQRLLSEHPAIASLPEPWFMLHLLYAGRTEGIATEYNARFSAQGLHGFIGAMSEGHDAFVDAVRASAMSLYDAALRSSGKSIFLDKTPRYYLVIPELLETFPEATFLFLVRDPLDVFSSILDAHAGGDWTRLARRDLQHDLLTAPRAIGEAIATGGGKKLLIHYEDLVKDPVSSLETICAAIGTEFDPGMLRYQAAGSSGSSLGDRTGIHLHERPVTDYVAAWRRRLDTDAKRGLADSYLRAVGPATLGGLGYDYGALEVRLRASGSISRSGGERWRVVSMPANERTWREELWLSWARSLHERGWSRTLLRALYVASVGRPPHRGQDSGVTE